MAAIKVNSVKKSGVGQKILSLTLDDDYPTGGYPCDLGALAGIHNVHFVALENVGGRSCQYDRANKTLLIYEGSTQVSSSGDLSAYDDARLLIFGD